jgi:hypothetical protein
MTCYGHFSLAMGSSCGFGSTRRDRKAPCSGSRSLWLRLVPALTVPRRVTRRVILQKARGQETRSLPRHGSTRVQGLFHSPRRGTFHRSLTVLCAIGRVRYVALGSGLPSFRPGTSCLDVLRMAPPAGASFQPDYHGLWCGVPSRLGSWDRLEMRRQPHREVLQPQ